MSSPTPGTVVFGDGDVTGELPPVPAAAAAAAAPEDAAAAVVGDTPGIGAGAEEDVGGGPEVSASTPAEQHAYDYDAAVEAADDGHDAGEGGS